MIKAGIIGSTGYSGGELARILYAHPETEVIWYGSKNYVDQNYASIYQNMFKLVDADCLDDDLEELAEGVDVIFSAAPQGYLSGVLTEGILEKAKVIDLSADYRIKDVATYEKWYGIKHNSPQLIQGAVYGLPEINREEIKSARLLANPGCYPTCAFLAIYPLIKAGMLNTKDIIIDAKSGASGAGRAANVVALFCEVNENMKAYKVASHRHTPEIEEQLGLVAEGKVTLTFTPHLVPMNRGILITAYGSIDEKTEEEELRTIYEWNFREEKFVRVLPKGACPQTKWVEGSNFADLNVILDERAGRVIMMGALDNLVKGAAGQAVQNMNLMFDLPEDMGLNMVPMFP